MAADYTSELIAAALSKYTKVVRLDNYTVKTPEGKWFQSRSPRTTFEAKESCKYKQRTRELLIKSNVPTPEGVQVSATNSLDVAHKLGWPLVVKPYNGSFGNDVTVGITDEEEFKSAVDRASHHGRRDIIIERSIEGTHYRVIHGHLVTSVIECRPFFLVGNGSSTISQLIDAENSRRAGITKSFKLQANYHLISTLHRQGYTMESVPDEGVRVSVASSMNIRQGAEPIEVTDSCPDRVKDTTKRALSSIPGLFHGCVDIVDDGITSWVIEINSAPGLTVHYHPYEGNGQPVADLLVKSHYE